MIEFHLDAHSGVAPYLQLVQQVKRALRLGFLQPGDRLPTVREVVAQITINPNTVFKAYRELEREGLVSSRPGVGTFILQTLPGPTGESLETLRHSLKKWLNEAVETGLDEEGIKALFVDALQQLMNQSPTQAHG